MTRVLFLIKSLGRGGAEQLLVSTAAHLDRSRFSAEVAYLLADYDDVVPELEEAGLKVTCLRGSRGVAWAGRLRHLVRHGDFDLIHVHSPHVASVVRLALPRPRPPLIYTEHAAWEMYRRPTYWANLLTYGRNDHVLTVAEHVAETIRYPWPFRFLKMPPVETLYHGIDFTAFERALPDEPFDRRLLGIPADAPVVGTIANFRPEKGHRYLLEAAVRVRESVPGVRFVLVGGGPAEEKVRRQAEALALDETVVVFAGYRDDAVHVASTFDVFVLPSLHEGLPIALVEAMALGKPVVVTDAGGMPEVVQDGKQGFVVPAREPEALAKQIATLLSDPALRERMGEESRLRAMEFDVCRAVKRLELLYGEVLANSQAGANRKR